ncbi:MAG TPA: PCRF domain-containing protein, partial [Acetobacteraceae bacterium]
MSFALKLDRIVDRAAELSAHLSEGATGDAYVKASRELAEIEPVVALIDQLRAAEAGASDAKILLSDPEMRDLAEAELAELNERIRDLQLAVRVALLPKDEADSRS